MGIKKLAQVDIIGKSKFSLMALYNTKFYRKHQQFVKQIIEIDARVEKFFELEFRYKVLAFRLF